MKITTFLLLLFFSSISTFCQTIVLEKPSKNLCRGLENELSFSLNGDFPDDDTFILYFLYATGEKVLMDSSKTSPIKFTTDVPYYRYMVESRKTKIQSNIINVRMIHTYVQVNPAATKACTGTIPMELWPSSIKYDKIQWTKDGKDIPDANGYAYYATESGNYYVRVINEGCMSLDSLEGHVDIKIGEIESPQISARFNSFNICDSISTHLTSYFRGIGDFQYQWQLNEKNIPGATENLYIAKQAGDYTLKISQGSCQARSNNERLTVASPEINSSPINWTQNGVAEICEGLDFDLLNSMYSNASSKGISLQWQKDNIDIPSATSYKFKVKEAGKYRLKIVRGDCITFSNSIIVKYTRPRLVNFNIDYKEYCIGEEVTTSVWWSNDFLKDSPKAKIYRDGQLFTESGYFENFKIKEAGKYHAILNFTIPNSTKVCTAYSDTVEVVFKDKIVNYEIKDFKSSVVCADSLFISGSNWGSTYKPRHQWKFNGMDLPNAKDYIISAKQSGIYQLETQTGSGCSYLSNPIKVQFKKLYPKITKFWPICSDTSQSLRVQISTIIDNLQVSNSINVFSYDWQLNGKTIGRSTQQDVIKGGIYKLTVKNGECSGSDSIMVDTKELKVNIPKTLTPNQDSLIVCINKYATLGAPQGDFSYTWLKDNRPFENNATQTIKVAAVGSFKVWIERENCGQMSNSIALKENKERITALISGNKELISGDSTRIKVDFTSLPPWTIKLTNNQEFVANKTPFEFAVKPLQTTVYELTSVKNDCGVGTVSGKAEIKIIILGNEELAGAEIKLYPVPTQGICQLTVETVIPERFGFQLFNVAGKMLMKSEENKPGHSFNEVINLESVPDGVYVLKIKIGDRVVGRKIIKGN